MSLRRFKPYAAYKQSGMEWLGEIPAHWEVKRIRHIVKRIEQGWSPDCENREADDDEWGVLKAGCVNRGVFVESEHKALPSTLEPIPTLEIRQGDLLMSRASGSRELVGSVAVVRRCRPRLLLCDKVFRLHVQDQPGSREFLAHAMNSRLARWQIEVVLSGGSGLANNIAQEVVKDLIIAQPPLNDQRAIAVFLDRETAKIDALVAKKDRLIDLLREKRTALITRAVTKGLDPNVPMKDSGTEWLGEIPAHWEIKTWRYCCHVTEGQVAPDDDRYRDRLMIAPNHIESRTGRLLFTETADEQGAISGKYLVKPGDIIYSKIRPALNKVCLSAGEWLCSADMYPVQITARHLSAQFLLYFMLSESFVRLMVDESMRVAMPKVNRETLTACPLVIPTPEEQVAIVELLDQQTRRVDALVAKVRTAIDRLKEFRTALISAAVTGKIDVRGEGP